MHFDCDPSPAFVFPGDAKRTDQQRISARPFVFVDENMRPYVLTRLKDRDNGTWEYTRFRAEANAVITRDTPEWLASLPEPTAAEYKSSEEDTGLQIPEHPTVTPQVQVPGVETTAFQASIPVLHADPQVPQTHQEAIQAIRDEDFEGAIQFFQRLVIEQPNYHVGWLRLGYAQRERAMRLRDNDIAAAKELLAVSITSLTRAAQHQYDDQRARAVYERSKAEFHRYRIEAAPEYKRAAIEDATEACRLSPDTRYETWIEYLERIT